MAGGHAKGRAQATITVLSLLGQETFSFEAGGPGRGTHARISCCRALLQLVDGDTLPWCWDKQSPEQEGRGSRACHVQRKLPDMAPEPAQQICCVPPPPAHLAGTGVTAGTWASCAIWRVGVQSVAGQVLNSEVGFCDGQVAMHRAACSVVSVMGFNASRHPTPRANAP